MTRWVQLGTFSPILRPHCAGRGGNSRDIWRFTWDSFEIMVCGGSCMAARAMPPI